MEKSDYYHRMYFIQMLLKYFWDVGKLQQLRAKRLPYMAPLEAALAERRSGVPPKPNIVEICSSRSYEENLQYLPLTSLENIHERYTTELKCIDEALKQLEPEPAFLPGGVSKVVYVIPEVLYVPDQP
ncbi:hypothetical protein GCM10027275_25070 [Rhabdobacter roseus]|uniref:Uncharacterized protein n=1 Tax=Rhabdobacter roseus TaxID=1655419 RepID=A0A840TRV9_9BACT|nr:hypothetical protein [Rhabdobacter roseus]MBB5284447.1 hypothetical protein [Rhabdobacter roseus]